MKNEPMNEESLGALVDSEMRNAIGYATGKMAQMRQKAMWYYYGEAKGDLSPPEIEGRSKVIVPVVRNTIESMMPQLMVKFAGSDQVVSFEPNKEGDEEKAEQATDYITYLYNVRNDGERITYNALKDALLSKKGIIKVWWDTTDEVTQEEYRAISDIELAQLMDDEEITVTAQKTYPDEEDQEQRQQALQQMQQALDQALQAQDPNGITAIQQQMMQVQSMPPKMLFDVTCKRTKTGGRLCVENVPPEEFLISRDAKTIKDARFVGHRVPRTISDLKSMGYKNVDQIGFDESGGMFNIEKIERMSWDDEMAYAGVSLPDAGDASQKLVWVTEAYVRCDYDGTGISQLRKVVRAGTLVLENEVVDMAPFVDLDPLPMPHKFYGMSVADLAMESQRTETSLLRTSLDNGYLQTNGRYFAVEGQVNLDDLLTSRPGGVVRIKQQGAAGRLDQGMGDMQTAMGLMEYMKGYTEDSTGWTRYNSGTDGDSLNHTATGVNIVTNRADMRLDLMARNLSKGFSDLFNMMLKLVCQYQQKEDVIKLRGKWVPIDPREWRNGFTVTINVGLGTGNRDQQIQQLMMLLQMQEKGLAIGVSSPETIYQTSKELIKALGYKTPDKFLVDPAKNPPQQQPNPEMVKAQSQMQVEQMKAQLQDQQHQREMQLQVEVERMKQEFQDQQAAHQKQLEAERDARKAELDAQVEMHKQALEAQKREQEIAFEKWKAELQAQTQIYIAQLGAGSQEPVETNGDPNNVSNALAASIDGFRAAIEQMNRPKTIVRGPDGRAAGIA